MFCQDDDFLDHSGLFLIPVRIGKHINDTGKVFNYRAVLLAVANGVGVPFPVSFGLPAYGEFKLTGDHDSPLGAVAVGRDFRAAGDLKKDRLPIAAGEEMGGQSLHGDVRLGPGLNKGRKRGLVLVTHGITPMDVVQALQKAKPF